MENITLSVNNLKKVIGKKEIIKGITFELKEGEVFGFLGPNGAGKTTRRIPARNSTYRILPRKHEIPRVSLKNAGIRRRSRFVRTASVQ